MLNRYDSINVLIILFHFFNYIFVDCFLLIVFCVLTLLSDILKGLALKHRRLRWHLAGFLGGHHR